MPMQLCTCCRLGEADSGQKRQYCKKEKKRKEGDKRERRQSWKIRGKIWQRGRKERLGWKQWQQRKKTTLGRLNRGKVWQFSSATVTGLQNGRQRKTENLKKHTHTFVMADWENLHWICHQPSAFFATLLKNCDTWLLSNTCFHIGSFLLHSRNWSAEKKTRNCAFVILGTRMYY